ncbi:hypothetical protein ABPG75_003527 [Micractinium tetrahymenae]
MADVLMAEDGGGNSPAAPGAGPQLAEPQPGRRRKRCVLQSLHSALQRGGDGGVQQAAEAALAADSPADAVAALQGGGQELAMDERINREINREMVAARASGLGWPTMLRGQAPKTVPYAQGLAYDLRRSAPAGASPAIFAEHLACCCAATSSGAGAAGYGAERLRKHVEHFTAVGAQHLAAGAVSAACFSERRPASEALSALRAGGWTALAHESAADLVQRGVTTLPVFCTASQLQQHLVAHCLAEELPAGAGSELVAPRPLAQQGRSSLLKAAVRDAGVDAALEAERLAGRDKQQHLYHPAEGEAVRAFDRKLDQLNVAAMLMLLGSREVQEELTAAGHCRAALATEILFRGFAAFGEAGLTSLQRDWLLHFRCALLYRTTGNMLWRQGAAPASAVGMPASLASSLLCKCRCPGSGAAAAAAAALQTGAAAGSLPLLVERALASDAVERRFSGDQAAAGPNPDHRTLVRSMGKLDYAASVRGLPAEQRGFSLPAASKITRQAAPRRAQPARIMGVHWSAAPPRDAGSAPCRCVRHTCQLQVLL